MKKFNDFTVGINPTPEEKAWERKVDKVMILILAIVLNLILWADYFKGSL
tara:strand:+ start:313 stop:462 length:150 start_codon:yes stop_codon:yes gene_type:complete